MLKTRRRTTFLTRKKLSDATKRAYREGRLIPPTTRPEVAAKISATKKKKEHNPVWKPEVRKKISETLKRKYASGEIVHARGYSSPGFQGLRTEETKEKLRKASQLAWKTGKFDNRKRPKFGNWKKDHIIHKGGVFVSKEELVLVPALKKMGFIHQFRFPKKENGHYSVDFAYPKIKLCIEIDGKSHKNIRSRRKRDRRKTAHIISKGFSIIRFTNEDVNQSKRGVLRSIRALVRQKSVSS